MRNIIALEHITLDGYMAGPEGEMDWIKLDDSMFDFLKTIIDEANTALYGRVTWQLMDAYWPTAAEKPNATKHDREHSEWYNKVDKIVISNSLMDRKVDKTKFIGGNIQNKIQKIKRSTGKDILLLGSPSVVRLLMESNLIDVYWLFLNPVILGKGRSIFAMSENKIELQLADQKTFSCGVIGLKFTI